MNHVTYWITAIAIATIGYKVGSVVGEGVERNLRKPSTVDLGQGDYRKKPESPKAIIVSFTAEWCRPCKRQKKVLKERASQYRIKLFDVDTEKGKELFLRYSGESVPLTVLVDDKKVIKRWEGFTPLAEEDLQIARHENESDAKKFNDEFGQWISSSVDRSL